MYRDIGLLLIQFLVAFSDFCLVTDARYPMSGAGRHGTARQYGPRREYVRLLSTGQRVERAVGLPRAPVTVS